MKNIKIHELKIWPEYFDEIKSGNKTFEIRKNDKDFKKGDWIVLREYDPHRKQYTGREMNVSISYTTTNFLQDGYIALAIIKASLDDLI